MFTFCSSHSTVDVRVDGRGKRSGDDIQWVGDWVRSAPGVRRASGSTRAYNRVGQQCGIVALLPNTDMLYLYLNVFNKSFFSSILDLYNLKYEIRKYNLDLNTTSKAVHTCAVVTGDLARPWWKVKS